MPFDMPLGKYDPLNPYASGDTKQAAQPKPVDRKKQIAFDTLNSVRQLLLNAGFPQSLVTSYAIAQVMLETNGLTSKQKTLQNNYSGIKNNKTDLNAGNGSYGQNGFFSFNTPGAWAQSFLRILSINKGAGAPIQASSLNDYWERLAANHYFMPSEKQQYGKLLNVWIKRNNDIFNWAAANNISDSFQDSNKRLTEAFKADSSQKVINPDTGLGWWDKLPMLAKIGIVAGAFVFGIKLVEK